MRAPSPQAQKSPNLKEALPWKYQVSHQTQTAHNQNSPLSITLAKKCLFPALPNYISATSGSYRYISILKEWIPKLTAIQPGSLDSRARLTKSPSATNSFDASPLCALLPTDFREKQGCGSSFLASETQKEKQVGYDVCCPCRPGEDPRG